MAYVKAPIPSEVYHLTQKDKLDDILDDGKIRRFGDTECWFCESLEKMKVYMEQTVLCEGKAYYGVGGQLCRYPKFEPDKHIILHGKDCVSDILWIFCSTVSTLKGFANRNDCIRVIRSKQFFLQQDPAVRIKVILCRNRYIALLIFQIDLF